MFGLSNQKQSRASRVRKPRQPSWLLARSAFVTAALFFAAFAVIYWGRNLWDASPALAVFVAAGFALSALVTPTVVPKIASARGGARWGLVAVCIVFGLVDTIGLTGAFAGVEKDMTQAAFSAEVEAHNAERGRLLASLARAEAALAAVPAPDAGGAIRRLDTWQAVTEPLRGDVETAKTELAALVDPVRPKVFNDAFVGLVSGLLQIALAIGLLTLEAARLAVHRKALEEYEAAKREERKRAEKSARAKAKVKAPAVVQKPRLVAAND